PRGALVRLIDAAARGGPPSRARREARRDVEVAEVAGALDEVLASARAAAAECGPRPEPDCDRTMRVGMLES
ncbi:MAG TPA: hypothetical protein VLW17_09690, partial [Thermoanaerobaculaceae bacterium]|nr:hypothetical protein [Thermoanaerobaculaceae bacterium]